MTITVFGTMKRTVLFSSSSLMILLNVCICDTLVSTATAKPWVHTRFNPILILYSPRFHTLFSSFPPFYPPFIMLFLFPQVTFLVMPLTIVIMLSNRIFTETVSKEGNTRTAQYIHSTHTVHTQYIHSTYTVHTQYIHSTYTVHTQYIHITYTVHRQYTHITYKYIDNTYTVHTQYIHSTYTVHTQNIHNTHTYIHSTYTEHTQYIRSTYTIHTQYTHVHTQYTHTYIHTHSTHAHTRSGVKLLNCTIKHVR